MADVRSIAGGPEEVLLTASSVEELFDKASMFQVDYKGSGLLTKRSSSEYATDQAQLTGFHGARLLVRPLVELKHTVFSLTSLDPLNSSLHSEPFEASCVWFYHGASPTGLELWTNPVPEAGELRYERVALAGSDALLRVVAYNLQ